MIPLLLAFLQVSPVMAAPIAPEAASAAVAPDTLGRYDAIRAALVVDDLPGTKSAASGLAAAAPGDPTLAAAASALGSANDLAAARSAFGELSRLLVTRIAAGHPPPKVFAYHCPMFPGYARWIQSKAGIANPYMGQAMPDCGEEMSLKAAAKEATKAAISP